MYCSYIKDQYTDFIFYQRKLHSTFLVTLGESLRMLLDNVVQGLPLQNTAGELVKDFTAFSLSLPVRFNYCFCSKNKETPIGRAGVTFSLCFEYVKHFV